MATNNSINSKEITWVVGSASVTCVPNQGYLGSSATYTLPNSGSLGDVIKFSNSSTLIVKPGTGTFLVWTNIEVDPGQNEYLISDGFHSSMEVRIYEVHGGITYWRVINSLGTWYKEGL